MLGFRVWCSISQKFLHLEFGKGNSNIMCDYMGKIWHICEERSTDHSGFEIYMQSTGLTDYFGIEIFEKDILIIIDHGVASYTVVVKEVKDFLINWNNIRNAAVVAIIGNVYENPKLLDSPIDNSPVLVSE